MSSLNVGQIIGKISPPFIWAYSKGMTWYTCGRKYDAKIDPFKIITIDPRNVKHKMTGEGKEYFKHSNKVSEVINGCWDKYVEPIDDYYMYESFDEHFNRQVPWEKTEFYIQVADRINNGEQLWGCTNLDDFKERLSEIDDLYYQIQCNGYKKQIELNRKESSNPAERNIHHFWPSPLNEVIVNINRNGEFILHDGRHRFIISKILGLDSIPVRIKVRHKKWQTFRDRQINEGNSVSHPDVYAT